MDAMIGGLGGGDSDSKPPVLSLPKDQWEKIATITRTEYLSGFKKAIAEMKKQEK
jgi:hypothetical protein